MPHQLFPSRCVRWTLDRQKVGDDGQQAASKQRCPRTQRTAHRQTDTAFVSVLFLGELYGFLFYSHMIPQASVCAPTSDDWRSCELAPRLLRQRAISSFRFRQTMETLWLILDSRVIPTRTYSIERTSHTAGGGHSAIIPVLNTR